MIAAALSCLLLLSLIFGGMAYQNRHAIRAWVQDVLSVGDIA